MLFGSTADTAEALRAAQKKARGKRRTALERAMESDLAQLDSGVMPEAMDKYYGLRYETPATLLDHLSSPIFILDEVGGIRTTSPLRRRTRAPCSARTSCAA